MTPNKELLLEIKGLKTYFHLAEGVVRAVDGVDLKLWRGHTLGVVGESGCGKSQTSMSIMRLVPPPGRIEEGQILYYPPMQSNPIDLVSLHPNSKEIRSIRGNQISMVFQEPMTAMSPVLTIGRQITEAIILHQQVSPRKHTKSPSRCWPKSTCPTRSGLSMTIRSSSAVECASVP